MQQYSITAEQSFARRSAVRNVSFDVIFHPFVESSRTLKSEHQNRCENSVKVCWYPSKAWDRLLTILPQELGTLSTMTTTSRFQGKLGKWSSTSRNETHTHTHRPACVALPLMHRMDGQRVPPTYQKFTNPRVASSNTSCNTI